MGRKSKSSGLGENEYHIIATRMRITGSGLFKLNLSSYDNIQSLDLKPLILQSATRFEPTILSNFQSQRTRLTGQTTNIDEIFEISRIIIFASIVAIEYPI